jgi:tRNA (mo5U34)-methyltransferase
MSTASRTADGVRDPSAAVARVPLWYHSIEVAPGLVTPGYFDLRPIVERMPWPDVSGLRCLDVGTSDGFLAFELERRGAAEVLAVDIAGHEQWDWERHLDSRGPEYLQAVKGPRMEAGFEIARELRGSTVQRRTVSVYDLNPDSLGEFDVVVCGSLLLHLRDPLRALAAIRSVCRGWFLSTNHIDIPLSVLLPRRPLARLDGTSGVTQWWIPNAAGHRQMLSATGFRPERESRLYSIPYGPAHPRPPRTPRAILRRAARRRITGNDGVPHHAILARVV